MASEENRSIVQLSLIDETGDSYHRMRWPARWISNQRPSWSYLSIDARGELHREELLTCDLLLLLQCGDIRLLPIMNERKKKNLKTVIEINDLFYEPQPWNPANAHWNNPQQWWIYEKFMDEADSIIVSSPGLKNYLSKWAYKITILENHIPTWFFDFAVKLSDEKSLGWGGSAGHMVDLLSITDTLEKFLKQKTDWKLRLMGDPSLSDFVRLKGPQIEYIHYSSMADYFKFLKNCRLGIVPLLDTPYNQCRSDIKALEMIASGTLPLLPKRPPYLDLIESFKLPSYETISDLSTLISKYSDDSELADKTWQNAIKNLKEFRSERAYSKRLDFYETLMPEKPSSKTQKGFKEIPVTKQPIHEFEEIFADWKSNRIDAAVTKISEKLEVNPNHSELSAMLILALKEKQPKLAHSKNEDFLKQFPHDLRFTILKFSLESEINITNWKDFIEKLKNHSEDHQNWVFYFVRDILLKKNLPLECLRDLKSIYSDRAEIRWALFNSLAEQKLWKDALPEMKWLKEEQNRFSKNKDFFSKWPNYIPLIWEAAAAKQN